MATNEAEINMLADQIFIDIEVAQGRALPDKSRRMFAYLQPHYDDIREGMLVERIVAARGLLDDEAKRMNFDCAVVEALSRCIAAWSGISRTLTLTRIAHRVACGRLPANTWAKLLDRASPSSSEDTASWLEQYVSELERWGIALDVRQVGWSRLIDKVPLRSVPNVGRWALHQVRHDPDYSTMVYRRVNERIATERAAFIKLWPDIDDVLKSLEDCFLPDIPKGERTAMLGRIYAEPDYDDQANELAVLTDSLNEYIGRSSVTASNDDEFVNRYLELED